MSSNECICDLNRWHICGSILGGVALGLLLSFVIQHIAHQQQFKLKTQQQKQQICSPNGSYLIVENLDGLTQKLAQNNNLTQKNQTIEIRKMGSRNLKNALQQGSTNVAAEKKQPTEQQSKALESLISFVKKSTQSELSEESAAFSPETVVQWASGTTKNIRKLSSKINRKVQPSENSREFPYQYSESAASSLSQVWQEQLKGQLFVEAPVMYENNSDYEDDSQEEEIVESEYWEADEAKGGQMAGGSLVTIGQFSKKTDIWV